MTIREFYNEGKYIVSVFNDEEKERELEVYNAWIGGADLIDNVLDGCMEVDITMCRDCINGDEQAFYYYYAFTGDTPMEEVTERVYASIFKNAKREWLKELMTHWIDCFDVTVIDTLEQQRDHVVHGFMTMLKTGDANPKAYENLEDDWVWDCYCAQMQSLYGRKYHIYKSTDKLIIKEKEDPSREIQF